VSSQSRSTARFIAIYDLPTPAGPKHSVISFSPKIFQYSSCDFVRNFSFGFFMISLILILCGVDHSVTAVKSMFTDLVFLEILPLKFKLI
jgi:hypothetical protein